MTAHFSCQETEPIRKKRTYPSDLVVVLDLDDCLIHTSNTNTFSKDTNETDRFMYHIVGSSGARQSRVVFLRPGWKIFLQAIMTRYETHLFTAGDPEYAKPIINELERRSGRSFASCLFRDSCTERTLVLDHRKIVVTVKDLRTFDRDLRRIVLIDDDPANFADNADNGIPVGSFLGNSDDATLESVKNLLTDELEPLEDVRPLLRTRFQIANKFLAAKELHRSDIQQLGHVYENIQLVQL